MNARWRCRSVHRLYRIQYIRTSRQLSRPTHVELHAAGGPVVAHFHEEVGVDDVEQRVVGEVGHAALRGVQAGSTQGVSAVHDTGIRYNWEVGLRKLASMMLQRVAREVGHAALQQCGSTRAVQRI